MHTTAVIVGAGHAGLAMSQRLTERSIDHVVLERGGIADAWRTQRWPGLRLLTPNWMLGLPGRAVPPGARPDPDGHLAAPEVADLVVGYARRIAAPVRTGVAVRSVRSVGGVARHGDRYEVVTDAGAWRAAAVVVATGGAARPVVPTCAAGVPASVEQRTARTYRGPGSLPAGGVLVVGASATGVQLTAEIRRHGRPVTLAVGEHVRLPRTYRGRDIFWWLRATGVLGERHDEVDDLARARRLPSPQLAGSATPVDLGSLVASGVRLVGRLTGVDHGVARFSGSLHNVCTLADLKMDRFLRRADAWAAATGIDGGLPAPQRFPRTTVPDPPRPTLDLTGGEVTAIVWATGFRPDHRWLDLPVFDRHGRLRHDGGVVQDAPGVYVLGLPLLRTRASTYIHGATADTAALADHLVAGLRTR